MKNKKKIGAKLKWATAHLSIGAVSQYNHCIVTQWDGRVCSWLRRWVAIQGGVLQGGVQLGLGEGHDTVVVS